MLDFDDDAPEGEIRAVSASVLYDGQIAVLLAIPGQDEPVDHTLPGDEHTVMMTHHGQSMTVDLEGTTAADRRCQRLVARGVARLNREMDRQRERMSSQHRQEWPD